jgi:hypothetical protein
MCVGDPRIPMPLLDHQNQFGHVHPIKMGYHDAVGEGKRACEWHNLGQSIMKSWLCLVGSIVGINFEVVESL